LPSRKSKLQLRRIYTLTVCEGKSMRSSEELLSLLTASMLSPEERSDIGLELDEIGDPRPGVGLDDDGLPDIDWVDIPAGEFLFGSTLGDLTAQMNEVPQTKVHLPAYRISRYPLTYTQVEAFVKDGGYKQKQHWTPAGKKWRGRKSYPQVGWKDDEWHVGNHPVIGVTWHEALAFCSWLSEKVGFTVTLPSESQWEKAARGTDGRRFPWGRQFYPQYANCGHTVQADPFTRQMETVGVGSTTAVGLYPDGASPYGLLDVAGNVWEWTLTLWREQYDAPENNAIDVSGSRALRGGSWHERETGVRAAVRKGAPPSTCDTTIGFRVCAM
jgi:formylglycine-generating enzyme required for sulfatase activity